ncbi:facilitated trehalose transporter Tret1-like isoform X1 [Euwallacea fornicatus]|uniref:facilitated trehalose transporter Tret1-like isoform X1 n=2 Tax=Euwallacea fornicatus TaxID=995702 RepID=UPI00338E0F91
MEYKRVITTAVLSTFSCVSDGMQYGWTAPIIPKLMSKDSTIKMTLDQAEWLETILMLGGCCGIPINLFLVDKIGRKGSLICSSVITLLSWVAIALTPNIKYLYVARFFAGIAGDTGFVAAPMYIAEIADHKIRGFLSSIIYLMMLIGIVLVYCVAPFTPVWVPCVLGICFNSITLCSFPFIPESPYYLLFKDRYEEAKHALERLRHDTEVESELSDIAAGVKRQKSERGKPQDIILVKSNRKALLIMIWLNASQHMSSISIMLMNLHSILDEAGAKYISSSTAGILFSALMLVAAISASLAIDNFGRRALLMTSGTLTGVCLLIIAVYFNMKNSGQEMISVSWLIPVAVMFYAAAFKFGIGLVPIVLTAELFSAKMKAIGMTLSDAFYVGFSVISLQMYHQLKNTFGIQVPFYIFAIWCFSTVIVTVFYIPETKGKTLEEIQVLLKSEESNRLLSIQNNNRNYTRLT